MNAINTASVGDRVFCTLFDSNYFSRGLAMYRSLVRHCSTFVLYIFAFDDLTYRALRALGLPNVIVVSLQDFEDEDLLRVKLTRTRVEYCWTSTPAAVQYVLERAGHRICTYLDADTYFFSPPDPLLDELGNDDVIITEHRYSSKYAAFAESYGIYNVQFVTFRATAKGLRALKWWREACLDSCELNPAEGKCGDQKYLDDWPRRFAGVHVLRHLGGGVAPWNVQQYVFEQSDAQVRGRELRSGRTFDLVFFHFHGFKMTTWGRVHLADGGYTIGGSTFDLIYRPYIMELDAIGRELAGRGFRFDVHGLIPEPMASIRERIRRAGARISTIRGIALLTGTNQNFPRHIHDVL